jgi:hypothetical protein
MHIRCGSCHGSIWVEVAALTAEQHPVKCACGRNYMLEGGRAAEEAGERLAAEARQLAREAQLDLPSAYSVLLGAMSLEDVLELGDSSAGSASHDASRAQPSRSAYDSGFQPSIDAGLLTPIQAMQRGNRKRYATLVSRRHRLPEDVGLAVADNRISLLEALRRRGPDPGPAVRLTVVTAAPPGSRVTAIVLVGVVVFVAIMAVGRALQSTAPTAAPHSGIHAVLGAQVRTDEFGRILEVFGPDPRSVLDAYCAADREKRYESLDVLPTAENGVPGRLGLLRRKRRSGEVLAIVLREDRAQNRWIAGDGKTHLVPRTAPRAAGEAVRERLH